MKKLLLVLFAVAQLAFAETWAEAHVIKQQIVVPALATSAPVFIPVDGVLQSIKLCSSFDSPDKNIEIKAEIENVWFGSVSQDCTSLDDVGLVTIPENSQLRLVCTNFDAVQRTCRVKVVYYTE
jgi:hypothetical protein